MICWQHLHSDGGTRNEIRWLQYASLQLGCFDQLSRHPLRHLVVWLQHIDEVARALRGEEEGNKRNSSDLRNQSCNALISSSLIRLCSFRACCAPGAKRLWSRADPSRCTLIRRDSLIPLVKYI